LIYTLSLPVSIGHRPLITIQYVLCCHPCPPSAETKTCCPYFLLHIYTYIFQAVFFGQPLPLLPRLSTVVLVWQCSDYFFSKRYPFSLSHLVQHEFPQSVLSFSPLFYNSDFIAPPCMFTTLHKYSSTKDTVTV